MKTKGQQQPIALCLDLLKSNLQLDFSHLERGSDLNELWTTLLDYYQLEIVYPTEVKDGDAQKTSEQVHNIHSYFHRRFEISFIEAELQLLNEIKSMI